MALYSEWAWSNFLINGFWSGRFSETLFFKLEFEERAYYFVK